MDTGAIHHEKPPGTATPRLSIRRRLHTGACLVLTTAGAALGLLSLNTEHPALLWNHSPSLPVGLYRIAPIPPARGDVVVIAPAGTLRTVLEVYGALPGGRLLLKELAGIEGDTVCRNDAMITVNGAVAATARATAGDGRALPAWSGCRTLGVGEVLVLTRHPGSFDSRYFGPIGAHQIVGVAHPLLALPSTAEAP